MGGWHGVLLKQAGHEGAQLHPEALRPEAVAVPERGGQHVQGLRDPRGGLGAQAVFEVTHDPLGTRRPVPGLRAAAPLGGAAHGQVQDVHQQLPGGRGHEQARVSLQGEDGVNSTWGGQRGEGGKEGFSWDSGRGAAGTLEMPRGLQHWDSEPESRLLGRQGGRPNLPRSEAGAHWEFTGRGLENPGHFGAF